MDLDFYFVLRPPTRAEVATVRMKATWKVSVSVQPEIPAARGAARRPVGLCLPHTYEKVDVSEPRSGGRARRESAKPTGLDSPAQHYSGGAVEGPSGAEVIHRSCLRRVSSSHWSELTAAAMQSKHNAPLKQRLNSTFHIACQILSKLHVMMLFSFWT